jgi:hypothetical protein
LGKFGDRECLIELLGAIIYVGEKITSLSERKTIKQVKNWRMVEDETQRMGRSWALSYISTSANSKLQEIYRKSLFIEIYRK